MGGEGGKGEGEGLQTLEVARRLLPFFPFSQFLMVIRRGSSFSSHLDPPSDLFPSRRGKGHRSRPGIERRRNFPKRGRERLGAGEKKPTDRIFFLGIPNRSILNQKLTRGSGEGREKG